MALTWKPMNKGISSQALFEGIKAHGHKEVVHAKNLRNAVTYLNKNLKSGDVLLTLGAGDVWKVGTEVLKALTAKPKAKKKSKK